MKNIYNIKTEQCLDYIIPKNERLTGVNDDICECAIVIIHVYYYERIDMYLRYIDNIPIHMPILITVSEKRTEELLKSCLKRSGRNYKIIMKENRGRDVSALLVAARTEILKYKYICFLHDKKEKNIKKKKDVEHWNYCLWENVIGSEDYVKNILYTFEKEKQLGLLVPPAPITENFNYGYSNTWTSNFENTKEIARQMNLQCDLNVDIPPVALGTVFWARTDALRKLFQNEWKYDDFDPEPLDDDGTFSHAIERILPYVAQDAGYYTGWVMTDRYGAEQFEYHIDVLKSVFQYLGYTQSVWHISSMRKAFSIIRELFVFCKKYSRIYIYGAGGMGKKCLSVLMNRGITPEAFLVTSKKDNMDILYGIPVWTIDEVVLDEACGVIVAVSEAFVKEIQTELVAKKVVEGAIFIYE